MTANRQQQLAAHVIAKLSPARMTPYLACTSGDRGAIELYRWNMALSGELHQSLALVEVVLRNAIDAQLCKWNCQQSPARGVLYDQEWVKQPAAPLWAILNPAIRGSRQRHSTYLTAHRRAEQDKDLRDPTHPRHGLPVTHDDVVAHITFGAWNALLPKRYPNGKLGPAGQKVLWNNAIEDAFPHHPDAPVIKFWVDRLHHLRNRVAHLEPLISLDVPGYHRTAARLLRAVDSDIGDWYAGTSNLLTVWKARPV